MRHLPVFVSSLALIAAGCGGDAAVDSGPAARDATDTGSAAGAVSASAPAASLADMGAELRLEPEIAAGWRAVRIEIVDRDTGDEQVVEVPLGGADLLGDTGLVLSAETFVPDFIMDENGIRSRTHEPHNPAVRVVISEDGMEDYRGWLFAAMPETLAYPHPRYRVLLVEGVAAQRR